MYILLITNTKDPADSTFAKCSSIDAARQIASTYNEFIYSFELISDFKYTFLY